MQGSHLEKILMQLQAKKLDDSKTHFNRLEIESRSSPDRKYIISQRVTTLGWECSCKGWTMHKARHCKHMRELKTAIEGESQTFTPIIQEERKKVVGGERSALIDLWDSLTGL